MRNGNAQDITKALGGRWSGNSGSARCPAHRDKTPSLSIKDDGAGRLLTYCHAGCSPRDVWAALQDRGLVERKGDRPSKGWRRRHERSRERPETASVESLMPAINVRNQDYALEIWEASQPAEGTLVEEYLLGRGIIPPIPPAIRYHPALKHGPSGLVFPCLVAAACNVNRQVTGIQRIYLTCDGQKVPVDRAKMALGPLRGSAVRLGRATDTVCLTEGIEDGLALQQMMHRPAWAVLGAKNFKNVELPDNIETVILAPDGDEAGQAVIRETVDRLIKLGRKVYSAKLPAGRDWVDVLEDFEERASILEYDGHMTREEAETRARREVLDG